MTTGYRLKGTQTWYWFPIVDIDGQYSFLGTFQSCGKGPKQHTVHVSDPSSFYGPIGYDLEDGRYELVIRVGQRFYRGTDVESYSNILEFSVGNVNQPPVVSNRTINMVEDSVGSLVLAAQDPDAGDSHTFSVVTPPNPDHGVVTISGSALQFTPKPNWNGTTTFTYRAVDSQGATSNVATVTVVVTLLMIHQPSLIPR